jgi:hypothetical protein
MFKATAKLYDTAHKVIAEHTGLGSTVILASEAAIKKLLDDVSPGRLRVMDWSAIETVVTRWRSRPRFGAPTSSWFRSVHQRMRRRCGVSFRHLRTCRHIGSRQQYAIS